MKKTLPVISTFFVVVLIVFYSKAGGPLNPPGAPGPTMFSLSEIQTNIGLLSSQISNLSAQVSNLQASIPSPSTIKSIQRGQVSLTDSSTVGQFAITINSVNMSKAFILITASKLDTGSSSGAISVSAGLVSAASIQVYYVQTVANEKVFHWQVVEFN